MADQDTLLLRLQRAKQKLSTWEWARDNAIKNMKMASAEVSMLRLELGKALVEADQGHQNRIEQLINGLEQLQ